MFCVRERAMGGDVPLCCCWLLVGCLARESGIVDNMKNFWYNTNMKQMRLFSLRGLKPCSRCGSAGPKYAGSAICKECAKKDAKEIRVRHKREDPDWHAASLAQLRKWYREHPQHRWERHKADKARRRLKLKKLGALPAGAWDIILEAWNYSCAYCGEETELQRDHVIPLCKNGTNDVTNIVPACFKCNRDKHTENLRDWLNDECLYESVMMGMGDAEYLHS